MRKFVFRLSTLTALIMALLAGAALFWFSQQVQQLESQKKKLEKEIGNEEDGIRVLNAEWAYLNRPDRLETLVTNYLGTMVQNDPENLLQDVNAIPEPQANEEDQVFLISTEVHVPVPVKKTPLTGADAKPIRDAGGATRDNFNQVLEAVSEGDE